MTRASQLLRAWFGSVYDKEQRAFGAGAFKLKLSLSLCKQALNAKIYIIQEFLNSFNSICALILVFATKCFIFNQPPTILTPFN